MKTDIYLGTWPTDLVFKTGEPENARRFWNRRVPRALRRFDTSRLPSMAGYRDALAWATKIVEGVEQDEDCDITPQSLLMFGGTGTGKTRTAYVLARYFVETGFMLDDEGYSDSGIVILTGIEFANQVVARTRPDGIGGFDDWMAELQQKDLLILDDLDKAKMTPRVELELFNVIDGRTRDERCTIITTQCVGEEFAALFDKKSKTGPAIIRRLREFFHPIDFDLAG